MTAPRVQPYAEHTKEVVEGNRAGTENIVKSAPKKATRKAQSRRTRKPDEGPFRSAAFEFGEQLAWRILGRYRWSPGMHWMLYNGANWEPTAEEALIPEVRDMIADYAPELMKRHRLEDALSALRSASSGGGIAGILKVARGWEGVLTDDRLLDAPRPVGRPDLPFLFPCSNGWTIEMYESGEWQARHSHPDDLLTKVGCAYDPEARAPFTGEMFKLYQPDDEIRKFILRIMVGSLRGVQIQNIFVWYGELAGNGKGTMQAVFSDVFGGYASTLPAEALMKSRNAREYRDELAQLKGARVVFADEPDEGVRFSPATVNRLTGGSPIKARGIGVSAVEFVPTWSLFMPCNNRPAMPKQAGLERRYNETPWDYVIDREKMTASVTDRVRAEASGVLNHLLDFWGEFCRNGINPPDVVREQTRIGKLQSNREARFLAACVAPAAGERIRAKPLYDAYKRWCEDENERPMSGVKFSESLLQQGLERGEDSVGRYYMNVKLIDHGDY